MFLLKPDFLLKGFSLWKIYPDGIHWLKVTNGNIRAMHEICSKVRVKTPEWSWWRRSNVFIVNSDSTSHIAVFFLLLHLKKIPAG